MELRVLYKCLLHVCQLIQHIIYKTVSGYTPEVRRLRTSFCQLLEQVGFAAWTTKANEFVPGGRGGWQLSHL